MATKSYQLPKITKKGREFILNRCNINYNTNTTRGTVLRGAYTYNQKDGKIVKNQIITPKIIDDNGNLITDLNVYAEQIIIWFEKYGKEYNLNPNVLAAQAYQESYFRPYAYPASSTAMGITQFTVPTIFNVIIENRFGGFDQEEIDIFTNGIVGDLTLEKTFIVVKGEYDNFIDSNRTEATRAINNSLILFENVTNNPKLMIKAQAIYLSTIAQHHNNLAASVLTLYFAGPLLNRDGSSRLISKTYGNLLDSMITDRDGKTYRSTFNGGVKYARDILDILGDIRFKTIGFGFKIDFTKIVGNDIKDSSKGLPLRTMVT